MEGPYPVYSLLLYLAPGSERVIGLSLDSNQAPPPPTSGDQYRPLLSGSYRAHTALGTYQLYLIHRHVNMYRDRDVFCIVYKFISVYLALRDVFYPCIIVLTTFGVLPMLTLNVVRTITVLLIHVLRKCHKFKS